MTMRRSTTLLCALLFVAAASAASVSFSDPLSGSPATLDIATTYMIAATISALPISDVTYTPTFTGPFSISPQNLTWTSTSSLTQNFTIRPTGTTPPTTLTYTASGTSAIGYFTVSINIAVNLRSFDVSQGYQNYPQYSIPVKVTSSSFAFKPSMAPASGPVTLTPTSTPSGMTFTPASLVFPMGSTASQAFTYSTPVANQAYIISWSLDSATDSQYYALPANVTIISVFRRIFNYPSGLALGDLRPYAGVNSQATTFSLEFPPPTGVTVTPRYSGTTAITFTPGVMTFTPSVVAQTLSFQAAAPISGQVVYFVLGGADAALYSVPNATITSVPRMFTFSLSGSLTNLPVQQNSGMVTVSTSYPSANGVTLTLAGTAGQPITFLPSNVLTFNAGQQSQTFMVKFSGAGSSAITYTIGGLDASLYAVSAPSTVTFASASKLTISSTVGFTTVACGTSTTYQLSISSPSTNGVTVSMSGSGLVITPSSLTFSGTTTTLSFTVVSNTGASSSIAYAISGADSSLFNQKSPDFVNFNLIRASTPLNSATVQAGIITAPQTVSLNYAPPNGITIAMSAPGVTFSPASLSFGPTVTSATFTVLAAMAGTTTVSYTVSGPDAGCFDSTNLGPFTLTVNTLPVVITVPNNVPVGTMSNVITVSIKNLASTVVLTPYTTQPGATFTPSSLTLSAASPSATFRFSANSTAINTIQFLVSGAGAVNVATPVALSVNVVLRQVTIPSNTMVAYVGAVSDPTLVTLDYAPINSLTITLAAPGVVFNPSVLTFGPGVKSQSFTFQTTAGTATGTASSMTATLGGPDAALYTAITPRTIFSLLKKLTPSFPTTNAIVGKAFTFTVGTATLPGTGVTITPVGAFTFNPTSVTLSPSNSVATFTAVPIIASSTSTTLSFVLSGTNAAEYAPIADTSITVSKGQVQINAPLSNAIYATEASSPATIILSVAPISDLTISIGAGYLTATPSSITFLAGQTVASFTLQLNPSYFTLTNTFFSTSVNFALSGTDAPNFDTPNAVTYSFSDRIDSTLRPSVVVTAGSTSGAGVSVTAYPDGNVSDAITVTLSKAPLTSVTFTPVTASYTGAVFNPASFTFGPSGNVARFYMTTTAFSQSAVSGSFVITGPDAYLYTRDGNPFPFTILFTKGSITTNGAANFYAGATQVLKLTSSTTPPSSTLTVTPYVITGPPLTFTPSAVTFSPSISSNSIAVTSTQFGSRTVGYTITGNDAAWFNTMGTDTFNVLLKPITITTPNLAGIAQYVGVAAPLRFTVTGPIFSDLTITPIAAGVTFTPSSVTLTSASSLVFVIQMTSYSFITPTVRFVLSGTDALSYTVPRAYTASDFPIAQQSFTFNAPSSTLGVNGGGISSMGSVTLPYPAVNGLTVTLSAPGFTFTPATLTYGPGERTKFYNVIAAGSQTSSPVTFTLGGSDASWYTVPTGVTISAGGPSVTTTATVTGTRAIIGFTLTAIPADVVTVTPMAGGLTFSPASFDLSPTAIGVVFTATSTVVGPVIITFMLSGPAAVYYMSSVLTLSVTFNPMIITITSLNSGLGAGILAGVESAPLLIRTSVDATSKGDAPPAPLRITFSSDRAGTIFKPAYVDITPPNHAAYFTVTAPAALASRGSINIYYSISGDGATAFTPSATPFPLVVQQRTFDVSTISNDQEFPATNAPFTYGLQSRMYTVYARTPATDVALTPISNCFNFTPSVLQFTANTPSASFTMMPIALGPCTIYWSVNGTDVLLFTRPDPIENLRVTYQVNWPKVPTLQVGQTSPPQTISLTPAPTSPFILTMTSSASVQLNPTRVVFTNSSSQATFTVTALAASVRSSNLVVPGNSGAALGVAMTTVAFTGRAISDTFDYNIPTRNAKTILVNPGLFVVSHPRYQMEVESKVEVQITAPPRSDVTVALWGNNFVFNPPYVTFVAGGPMTQTLKVTPRGSTSYEQNYAGFRVDYVCGGTNQQDYICPSESVHYIALSRGYIAAVVIGSVIGLVLLIAVLFMMRKGK